MEKKMSLMGVGGKIAIVLIISIAITACISYLTRPVFRITEDYQKLATIAVVMIVVGFALNLIASFGMMRATKKGQLATGGFYSIFLHPMYTLQILITVPGLLLLFNSWLVLAAIIPSFVAVKVFAKEEEKYLEEKFGTQYKEYREKVLIKFL